MTTAQEILIVYGTLSLAVGFALGVPLSQVRMASPEAPRHLVTAHLAAIIQGAVHLSLSIAVAFSELSEWLETTAAVFLVAGSALFVAGAVTNWLQHVVGDHFARRTLGWKLFAASSARHVPGIAIMVIGVLTGI